MTNTEGTPNAKVHVRTSEVASSAAVELHKRALAGGLQAMTFHSRDDQGLANRVAVTEVMWTASDRPTIVFILENGQEFEAEVRHSNRELRHAANELELARQRAERAQDIVNGKRVS